VRRMNDPQAQHQRRRPPFPLVDLAAAWVRIAVIILEHMNKIYIYNNKNGGLFTSLRQAG
jgi:hypothetical protein